MNKIFKSKTLILTFVYILSLSASGFAVSWNRLYKDIKSKYDRFDKDIKDMTMQQVIDTSTPAGKTTSLMKLFKKDVKYRVEVDMSMPDPSGKAGSIKNIVINDGKDTWIISSLLGKRKLSPEETSQIGTDSDWWKKITDKGKIVKSEAVNDFECYVVEFSGQEQMIFSKLWIDKKKLVMIKGESNMIKDKKISWMYSDFRSIAKDWEIPYMTEVFSDTELISTSVVKSVVVNTGLSDELFDADKIEVEGSAEIQKMLQQMMQQKGE